MLPAKPAVLRVSPPTRGSVARRSVTQSPRRDGTLARPMSSQPPPQAPPPGQPVPPPGYGPPSPPPAGYYPPPRYYAYPPDPSAPYGRHPLTGEPYSDKQKLTAGLLELFLGQFGAGRWYLGDNGIALGQLFTCGGCGIWSLVDSIMMLTGNVRDKYGRPLRD
jgi:hypothetical protein